METGKESERMMAEGVERTGEGRVPFIGWDGALGAVMAGIGGQTRVL
jgi:hypothetical protein